MEAIEPRAEVPLLDGPGRRVVGVDAGGTIHLLRVALDDVVGFPELSFSRAQAREAAKAVLAGATRVRTGPLTLHLLAAAVLAGEPPPLELEPIALAPDVESR